MAASNAAEGISGRGAPQTQAHHGAGVGRNRQLVAGGGFGSGMCGVDGIPAPETRVLVKRVLDVRRRVRLTPKPGGVRLVLCEQQFRRALACSV